MPKKEKECFVGLSCGFSCISGKYECSKELGPKANEVANKMAQAIMAATVTTKKTGDDFERNSNLSSPEDAKAYLDVFEGKKPPHTEPQWQAWAKNPRHIEKVWASLDKPTRAAFERAGFSTGVTAKDGPYKGGGEERAKAVLQLFIASGGKDITGKALDQWNRQIELDHKTPVSKGGKDEPANWQMISSKVNQLKQGTSEETFLAKLRQQANSSKEDYEAQLGSGKAAKDYQKALINSFSDKSFRGNLTDADLAKYKTGDLDALLKGMGMTDKVNRIGKRDAEGNVRPFSSTGALTNPQKFRLAREALILERMRNQGLTDYPHPYLPKTMREIQDSMDEKNKTATNLIALAKPMKMAIDYKGAPDISGFELIPQIASKA